MQQQKTTLKNFLSRWRYLASLGLGALIVLFVVQQASAGPITNPGGAPYAKLSVYQGVLSIVPNGSGDSVMEIGNAGRDIKSTGGLNILPGGGGDVLIGAQNAANEGAEIQYQASTGSYSPWFTDVYQDRFRIFNNGGEKFTVSNDGNAYVTNGKLCFGLPGSTNCSNSWAAAATPTLDSVLSAGNSSARSASIGSVTVPNAKLVVNSGTAGAGSAGDAIAAYTNSSTTGIYSEQQGTGWYAGYFSHGASGRNGANSSFAADGTLYADNLYESGGSTVVNANAGMFVGDVEIRQKNTFPSFLWSAGDVLKVVGDTANPAPGGYPLHVVNTNSTGYSAGFNGAVTIAAQTGKYGSGTTGALNVFGMAVGGTGIYGQGGNGDGSIGVLGQGYSVPTGQSSYGLYGAPAIGGSGTYICGDNTSGGNCYSIYGKASNGNGTARTYAVYGESGLVGGGAISYAGYFKGRLSNNGLNTLSMATIVGGTTCSATCTAATMACAYVVVPAGGATLPCTNSTAGNICVCQSQ